MNLEEALDHSLPRLQLLARAAERLKANQGLLDLSISTAAAAVVQTKKGQSLFNKTQKALKKAASYGK